MNEMDSLSKMTYTCPWCNNQGEVQVAQIVGESIRCLQCNLTFVPDFLNNPVQKEEKAEPKFVKGRKKVVRTEPFNLVADDDAPIFLGIDPGARFTGVVARRNDAVLFSTTVVRPEDVKEVLEYVRFVVDEIKEIVESYPNAYIGVESISDPKGYKDGKKSPLNPRHIMTTAAVAGAVASHWRNATPIAPQGNGSQHESHYPPALIGRRPKDLPGYKPGIGTRSHERSAYDVAGKVQQLVMKVDE